MEDKWRKQMQQKLEGHEQPLPDLSWDELDNALAANRRQAGSLSAPQSRMYVWGRRFAAAAAISLIIIGGAVYYLSPLPPGGGWVSKLSKEQQETPISGKTEMLAESRQDNKLPEKSSGAQHVTVASNHEQLEAAVLIEEVSSVVPTEVSKNESQQDGSEQLEIPLPVKEENSELPVEPRPKEKRVDSYKRQGQTPPTGGQGGSRLLAAAYTQNAFNRRSDGMGGMTYLPYGDANSEFSNGTNGILENNAPKSVTYDHDYPIKVGVGIRYRINKRWSLATGLTYSYLHSTYEASEKGNHWTGKQSLHYVGLPLAVSYNVLSANSFNLYITAGGEMQKLVSGKSFDNELNLSETVKEGRMQWSLNAAIGAQYNFTKNIGLYLEPGVVHYIDNGSRIENYYKYKPTNFNLNVGVRLDL